MFGIGPFEMLVIAAIALMVIGPEKFPEFAKIVFRTITDFKQYINETKRDIEREMRPMQKELRELSKYKPEEYIDKLAGTTSKTAGSNGGAKAPDASADDSAQSAPPPGNTHPYDFSAQDDAEAIKSGLESEEGGAFNPEPEAPAPETHPADRAAYEEERDRNAGKPAPEHPLPERLDG